MIDHLTFDLPIVPLSIIKPISEIATYSITLL